MCVDISGGMSKGKMRRHRAQEWERGVCEASLQKDQKYHTFSPWRELPQRPTGRLYDSVNAGQSVYTASCGNTQLLKTKERLGTYKNPQVNCGFGTKNRTVYASSYHSLKAFSICATVVILLLFCDHFQKLELPIQITLCCWSAGVSVGYSSMLMWLQRVSL